MEFQTIKAEDLSMNVIQSIRYDWLLITGGDKDNYNSMTACWGGIGHLWDNHHCCFIFIRPSRYTYEFLEKYDYFTIQFFNEKYKDKLHFLGTTSGRDMDKIEKVDFTPIFSKNNSVYYEEAKMVIDCKKIYYQDIDPENFLDKSVDNWYKENYPEDGYHRMYVGSIDDILIKNDEKKIK